MRCKSDIIEKFKEYRALVKKQLGKMIKTPRSERGEKYFLGECEDYLKKECIIS